ncbi:hypothetical protein HBI42_167090 [Parastagonospora nodorum]|nr:hypothetical protein HBI43_159170 [Parastagonospora nodorum]KAH6249466.1 hypothetical protein HBI42_167090 [Parastagonospora nodorum]
MLFLISCATEKVHIYAADSLSSTITVYNYIKKDKNADLAIANSISDALDMCVKNDLIYNRRLVRELATAESITTKELLIARGNNILSLIAFIISYCLFADKLVYALNKAIVVLIIILVDKTQLLLILGDVAAYTLLAKFIPITKIRDPLLKKNVAKSRILLTCVDRRIRQCYLTICAILKHYNFNIYVSLATDTLHLLLKGLVIKMLDFITSLKRFNNKRAFIELIAIVSPLFILKAPFALYFIRAVCDLVTLAQYKKEEKNFNYPKALDSICTRANSEAHYITILIPGIQPYLTKLPLSEVAVNIAISDFIHAAAVFRSSSKRYNDSKYCNEEVLYLILIIIDYTCYDKDRKHIAYIRVFSKFYDLSTIICSVHLVLRDLPNLITRTTMSYYVNNYIN